MDGIDMHYVEQCRFRLFECAFIAIRPVTKDCRHDHFFPDTLGRNVRLATDLFSTNQHRSNA
jgi:hypothetical protein